MYERPARRLKALAFALILLCVLIIGQLVRIQVISHARLAEKGNQIRHYEIAVKPMRGRVWDRDGHLLVEDSVRYDISVSPALLSNPSDVAKTLADSLGQDADELLDKLSSDLDYVVIEHSVSKELGDKIRAQKITHLTVEPVWRRTYPEGSLGAHLLGFVNLEDLGYYGIEGYYDAELRGSPGRRVFQRDRLYNAIPLVLPEEEMPRAGLDLVLTLDRTVQALVEQELSAALEETGAKSGVIIVMNPTTGAILAMAAAPVYDPNHFWSVTDTRTFVNPAISGQYEPGSVFKVLTAAVALESGKLTPDTAFYDEGCIEVRGQIICNATRKAYGNVTMTDALVHSLNVEMAKISIMLGPEIFYAGINNFGIGHLTGVDLEGEIIGKLRVPGDWDWHESDLATNSFGQGLAVTPLQMITAVAAIANDGVLMQPYVVAQKIHTDGQVTPAKPVPIGWAVSAETARKVTEMMALTVDEGVKRAQVPGYRVAGKTGTAEMPTAFGYDEQKTIASFVGFAPVDDPEVIVLVRLDEPTSSPWGSQTAAPAFSRLAQRLFVLLEIPPDDVRHELSQSR